MTELIANEPDQIAVVNVSIDAVTTELKTSRAAPEDLQGGDFRIVLFDGEGHFEIPLVTGGQSGTSWTIVRAYEDAVAHPAKAWPKGTSIYHELTAGSMKKIAEELATAGPEGPRGPEGPKGTTGATGPEGPKGTTGATGPEGPKGTTGATGPEGPKGSTGATGAKGEKGETGSTGATGATGPEGPKGTTGATGAEGKEGKEGKERK